MTGCQFPVPGRRLRGVRLPEAQGAAATGEETAEGDGGRQIRPESGQSLQAEFRASLALGLVQVMGAYSYAQDPGNEYLLITAKTGWDTLAAFWAQGREELYRDWDATIAGQHPGREAYLSSAL